MKIPKLRYGSFFPSLLERRRRIDRALFALVMQAYVHGVSTRKVDDLVQALGVASGISKSEVSRICSELDVGLEAFRARRRDYVEFPYVFADATYVKGRVDGRVVFRPLVVATGVTAGGDREVLGVEVGDSETGAFWTSFFQEPPGPRPVRRAAGHLRPPPRPQGRHRSHVRRLGVAAVPGALHAQRAGPGPEGLRGDGRRCHPHRVRPTRRRPCPLPAHRGAHRCWPTSSVTSPPCSPTPPPTSSPSPTFPQAHWRKIWSTNPLERLNGEIKRRTNVVGIFPNDAAIARLVTAVIVETHDEWAVSGRRYLAEDSMANLHTYLPADPTDQTDKLRSRPSPSPPKQY